MPNPGVPDLPLVALLPTEITPEDAFLKLAALPHVIFFDTASQSQGAKTCPQLDGRTTGHYQGRNATGQGEGGSAAGQCELPLGRHWPASAGRSDLSEDVSRYSWIAADPFEWLSLPMGSPDPLARLEAIYNQYPAATREDLPPFQGGAAGLLSYELAHSLENLPAAASYDLTPPVLAVGLYDVVVAFDHQLQQGWIISQGFPATTAAARRELAKSRLEHIRGALSKPAQYAPHPLPAVKPRAELAPQFEIDLADVTSNLSAASYREMVERAVAYIHAGDVFQVNLAQRLLCPAQTSATELYRHLRRSNPAPYAGYLDTGAWQICSTSPECFLTLRGDQVETRPIKGTRGRLSMPEADLFRGDELRQSEKDRAENVMIVDLLRNDLARVCLPDSVHVAQLCQLEEYAFVKHLVSVVRGRLQPAATPFDLLRACFPGGSITGAPKIRAMEIIAELEPTARGAYCGSLFYLGFDGQLDSSILIRTITAGHGWWQLPVGGGIVAQSQAPDEYQETWHKARGMLLGTVASSKP